MLSWLSVPRAQLTVVHNAGTTGSGKTSAALSAEHKFLLNTKKVLTLTLSYLVIYSKVAKTSSSFANVTDTNPNPTLIRNESLCFYQMT